jgi:hypothetical protein
MIEPCGITPPQDDLPTKIAGYLLPLKRFLVELRQHRAQQHQQLTVYPQVKRQFLANNG